MQARQNGDLLDLRELPPPGKTALLRRMESFREYLENPLITEVVVNRPGEIGAEAGGEWSWHEHPELTFKALDAIAILAAYQTNRDIDGSHPLCTTRLPGGERLQICRPAATMDTISFTIRKPSKNARKVEDDDFDDLFSRGQNRRRKPELIEELLALKDAGNWREFFRAARMARMNIGLCGRTGSGKTDLVKRFMNATPPDRRIVTIEDTSETGGAGPRNQVNLFY